MHTNREEMSVALSTDLYQYCGCAVHFDLINRHTTTQRAFEKSIGYTAVGLPDDLRKRRVTQHIHLSRVRSLLRCVAPFKLCRVRYTKKRHTRRRVREGMDTQTQGEFNWKDGLASFSALGDLHFLIERQKEKKKERGNYRGWRIDRSISSRCVTMVGSYRTTCVLYRVERLGKKGTEGYLLRRAGVLLYSERGQSKKADSPWCKENHRGHPLFEGVNYERYVGDRDESFINYFAGDDRRERALSRWASIAVCLDATKFSLYLVFNALQFPTDAIS